jgi:hypothetical protein
MSMIPIKEKYAELVAFFQWWIPAYLPSANLYLEGQSAPRPANPYISFDPLDEIDTVGLDERRVDSEGNELLRGHRTVSCSLAAYSDSATRFDGNDNAWEMLQELKFSLGYPEVYDKLSAINCRVLSVGSVDSLAVTLNTTNEPRASFDFTLSTVIVQTIDNGTIAEVNAVGQLTGTIRVFQADVSVTKP